MTSAFGAPRSAPPCPCGSGEDVDACCGPVLTGRRAAATAEQLMRSRFTAYARGDLDHLFRSWHPSHRPRDLSLDPAVRWTALRVLDVVGGGADDSTGVVEFEAHYVSGERPGRLHERSLFTRRGGRWVYLHAE